MRAIDQGVFLPQLGLALNAKHDRAPALCTHPDALRPVARRQGVLATQETWTRAFPHRKAPRVAAPVDRPLNLGEIGVVLVPHPGEPWFVHLRILGYGVECVHVTCPPGCPRDLSEQTGSEEASLLLVGPLSTLGDLEVAALDWMLRCWPRARVVLYGPAVLELEAIGTWTTFPRVDLVRPPVQETLL